MSKRIIIIFFIFTCVSYNLWRNWGGSRHPFTSDIAQYYSYVDAVFIHHDLSFRYPASYWLHPTPAGYSVPQMSMGLALLFTPAFLLCHAVAYFIGAPMDGYSDPYAFGLYYYGMLFALAGLVVLRKILLRYYSEKITSLVLVSVFMGTNLFYYTVGSSLMSHGFLFTLYALMLFHTIKWYETNKLSSLYLVAFICGLCTLIRPTAIFMVLVPLLFDIKSRADIMQRIELLNRFRLKLLIAAAFFIIPWIPQLIYWKVYAGSWFYYSYGEQGFDFSNPQFINVLFSFRKGWLLYTPLMAFALAGFYFLYRYGKQFFWPVLIYFSVTFYVLSSWWCWSWGGSFSIRAFVESYAFLALPMATCYKYIFEVRRYRFFYFPVIFLTCFNLYQTWQYRAVVLHWDNTTKESYFYGLFKLSYTPDERAYFNTLLEVHGDSTVTKEKNE